MALQDLTASGLRWLWEHNEHHKIVASWIKVSICDKKVNASRGRNRWKGSLWQQILWFSAERANCKILFECKMCWSTLSLCGSSQPLGVSRAGRSHASAGRSHDFSASGLNVKGFFFFFFFFSANDYRESFRGFCSLRKKEFMLGKNDVRFGRRSDVCRGCCLAWLLSAEFSLTRLAKLQLTAFSGGRNFPWIPAFITNKEAGGTREVKRSCI